MGTIYLCNIFVRLNSKSISQQQTCNFNLFLTVASFHVLYLLYTNASCGYFQDSMLHVKLYMVFTFSWANVRIKVNKKNCILCLVWYGPSHENVIM